MTGARKTPLFFEDAGRSGHLFDFVTSYVSFSPGSQEELEYLGVMMWRLLYPAQVIADCREARKVCQNA